MKEELQKFLDEKVLEYTKYTRNDELKSISASQVGNDVLQNYLIALFPNEPQIEISQNTFGSLTHGTMQNIFAGEIFNIENSDYPYNVITEFSGERVLPNGWKITGTADIVMEKPYNRIIIDHKLTKIYAGKMFLEGKYDHQYTKQLNAYRWIFDVNPSEKTDMYLNMMYKDADPLKNEKAQELIEVPEIEIQDELLRVTTELETAIDSGELPPRCYNLWKRTPRKGPYKDIEIEARCEFYCSQNKVCPYFKSKISKDSLPTDSEGEGANTEPSTTGLRRAPRF